MYAGFWNRFAAYFFDYLILLIPLLVLNFLFGMLGAVMAMIGSLLILVGIWLYEAFLLSSEKQATLGKIILGVKVSDLDGNPISFLRATGRFWAKFIGPVLGAVVMAIGPLLGASAAIIFMVIGLIIYIGPFVMAAFTPRRQALHDMIASTMVVDASTAPGTEPAGIKPAVGWAILTSVAVTLTPVFAGIFGAIFLGAALFSMAGGAATASAPELDSFGAGVSVSNAAAMAEGVKFAVEQYAQTHNGIFPGSNDELANAGMSIPTELPGATIAIGGEGQIVVTMTEPAEIAGRSLQFTPVSEGSLTNWTCTSPDLDAEYLPSGCSNQ